LVPATIGFDVATLLSARSVERATVVVAVALLPEGFGSAVVDDAVTVFESVPAGRSARSPTVIVRLAVADCNIVPTRQLTCWRAPTRDVVQPGADTTVTPSGRRSVSVTAAAVEGPALLTPSVNDAVVPAIGFGVVQALVAVRSAEVVSEAVAVALLFVETGSPAVLAEAVLSVTVVAPDATVPVIWAETVVPTLTLAQLH
jgi:hypothetical protein